MSVTTYQMQEGKYICLYGGEDIDWIQRFTTTMHAVAQAAQIPLEMLYVGKSNLKEKVRKNNTAIATQGVSHVLPDVTLVWWRACGIPRCRTEGP